MLNQLFQLKFNVAVNSELPLTLLWCT